LRIPIVWMHRNAAVAEVLFVQGRAVVQHGAGGATGDAAAGDTLREDDLLRTDAEASVTLRFADGSRLLVIPGTEIAMARLLTYGNTAIAETRLRLTRGSTDAQVTPERTRRTRFEISTPIVNLGVRGTQFRARVDPADASTRVEVLQGTVALLRRGETRLHAGFGAVVQPGERVAPTRRLGVAPELADVPTLIERLPLRLTWQPVQHADGYRAQVFQADAGDRLMLDGIFTEPAAKWPDLPDGHYVLRVRALDTHALEGMDASAPFRVKARPEPPFTQRPVAGALSHGDAATFGWARPTAAARYRLQVATTPEFAAPLIDAADITVQPHRVPLSPGAYYWRVASIALDGDQGPFSGVQAFTQVPVPASPDVEPAQLIDENLVFHWRSPGRDRSVQFQFASNSEFSQILLDLRTDATQAMLPKPPPGVYFLRARTLDADGFVGEWGTTQQVEVPRSRWWLLVPLGMVLLLL
jgi:hypothetical protein